MEITELKNAITDIKITGWSQQQSGDDGEQNQ